MADNDSVTITHQQVEEWKREVADLQAKIAAAQVLLPVKSKPRLLRPASSPSLNFMGRIAAMANSAPKPISKVDLKKTLKSEGFPSSQVDGTYFYVALKKLEGSNRISVLGDGTIWKGTR